MWKEGSYKSERSAQNSQDVGTMQHYPETAMSTNTSLGIRNIIWPKFNRGCTMGAFLPPGNTSKRGELLLNRVTLGRWP